MRDVTLHRLIVPGLQGRRWTSSWISPGHPVADAVASWSARVPDGSVLHVEMQGRLDGHETAWYALGRWSEGEGRTTVADQQDDDARVDVDVLVATEPFEDVRLRATLDGVGEVRSAAVSLAGLADATDGVSAPGAEAGIDLDVPAFSQQAYAGVLPELDGGGEAWCSPTSLAMVLSFWGSAPPGDPVVDAARGTYDAAYGGCGNWSFNTAYAAQHGLDAVVTRLRSLAEAEQLLGVGVPLVLSIRSGPGELDGFPLEQGTPGHLIVLRGIGEDGAALVNDPAAATPAEVPRAYDRAQLERAWVGGSGGAVYVVRPPGVSLPEGDGAW
jgi:peptidase C39-like protein